MKKLKIYLSLACAIPLFATAQQKPFTLLARVNGLPDNEKVYLLYVADKKLVKDSALVQAGNFSFKGTLAEPVEGYLRIEKDGKIADITHFYLEPATLKFEGKTNLKTGLITNSVLNTTYYPYSHKKDSLISEIVALKTIASHMSKEDLKGQKGKDLNTSYFALQATMIQNMKAFVGANPGSAASLAQLTLLTQDKEKVEENTALFKHLSQELQNSPSGKMLQENLLKLATTKKGVNAPLFTSTTPVGDQLQLKEVIGKSKFVLLDFWASWCAPCRAENPNVVKAYEQYHDKGFNILSVSLDKTSTAWIAAIEKDHMPWYHVSSLKGWEEPAALLYNVNGVPDNFLIDAKGKIIARGLRGAALEAKLKEIFSTSSL